MSETTNENGVGLQEPPDQEAVETVENPELDDGGVDDVDFEGDDGDDGDDGQPRVGWLIVYKNGQRQVVFAYDPSLPHDKQKNNGEVLQEFMSHKRKGNPFLLGVNVIDTKEVAHFGWSADGFDPDEEPPELLLELEQKLEALEEGVVAAHQQLAMIAQASRPPQPPQTNAPSSTGELRFRPPGGGPR